MLQRFAAKLASRAIVRDTFSMMVGFCVRLVTQAAFFVLVARALRVEEYGVFMAAAALSAVVAPFASLGTGNLLIKNVARDRSEFARRWGDVLIATAVSGTVLLVLLVIGARLFLGSRIPLWLLVDIAAADLFFARLLDASGQAFQATGRIARTAQLQVLPNVGKLVAAAILMVAVHAPTAVTWSVFYLGSAVVTATAGVWLVFRELGPPELRWRTAFRDTREGTHFSIALAAQNVYNDIDKTMLARMSTAAAVGTYAAAYRLLDVAFAPVRSVMFASYTGFFRAGVGGIRGTVAFARRLIPFAWTYAAFASLGLFVAAPIVPFVLGADYAPAVVALRWLAVLPLIKAVHYMAADSLTGAGHQSIRSRVQILVAVFNVVANLLLVPRYSWLGAAAASIASDGLLAVTLWGAVATLWLRSPAPAAAPAAPALAQPAQAG